mmetsp:Transcript_1388/g.5274  ORF Transcript_1388/g.5274 Transcript_1388/m.5274 type:complete len:140 (+) Transcript_1388:34-453(+)
MYNSSTPLASHLSLPTSTSPSQNSSHVPHLYAERILRRAAVGVNIARISPCLCFFKGLWNSFLDAARSDRGSPDVPGVAGDAGREVLPLEVSPRDASATAHGRLPTPFFPDGEGVAGTTAKSSSLSCVIASTTFLREAT